MTYKKSRCDLTYNLTEAYYEEIGSFAGLFTEKALSLVGTEIDAFRKFRQIGIIRTDEEYITELLSFGVLLHTYGTYSEKVKFAPFALGKSLADIRKKNKTLKPAIDIIRGVITSAFLLPGGINAKNSTDNPESICKNAGIDIFDKLFRWLAATGEYREMTLRYNEWREFLTIYNEEDFNEIAGKISKLAALFIKESEKALGKYTEGVDIFRKESALNYKWREDRIQCMSSREIYHLNMLGAELMNRAFRADFLNTEVKAILLPGCMRTPSETGCKAKAVPEGFICTGCTKECGVNKIRIKGRDGLFETYIIPHSSNLALWAPSEGKTRRGVIAVACATSLIEGGLELKRYGVPAQCILLNFSGCKKHWHYNGISTCFNIKELDLRLESMS
jgi:hypothetical protein